MDLISYAIKTAASPTRCNDIARNWYCASPVPECAPPRDLPVEAVHIEEDDLLDLGLGRSIYSKEQVEEFLWIQDS